MNQLNNSLMVTAFIVAAMLSATSVQAKEGTGILGLDEGTQSQTQDPAYYSLIATISAVTGRGTCKDLENNKDVIDALKKEIKKRDAARVADGKKPVGKAVIHCANKTEFTGETFEVSL